MKISCPIGLTVVVLLTLPQPVPAPNFLNSFLSSPLVTSEEIENEHMPNPCCSFPCLNRGVCLTTGYGEFECDCDGTGYYGEFCERPSFWKKLAVFIRPDPDNIHLFLTEERFKWVMNIINWAPWLKNVVMKQIYIQRGDVVDSPPTYTSEHDYITYEAYGNFSYFARALPPVPRNCPTPLGVVGKKTLPDAGEIVERLMKRTEFKPEPLGSNALFTFFAQHFTHQFFKTDFKRGPGFTWGGHGVDVSHVYGKDKHTENMLRSFTDGKMKMQVINGETWPMYLKDANVSMTYPAHVPEGNRFALGHKDFGLLPGLFMYATIWMREHNRVCDILLKEHTEWDEERVFQTAKLIILGETIKIVIEDYVQHLSNYNYQLIFNPELLFNTPHQYSNRITAEFNHMYHWHPLMPETFNISGHQYSVKDFLFHPEITVKHGMKDFLTGMINERAGSFTSNNHNIYTLPVAKETILHGRELRYQSFNQYRRRFGLTPYRSFEDLTGDPETAAILEELYEDVDAVEFYVGIVTEKHRPHAMFGGAVIELGGPFSVKGLMSAPICSQKYWKPSTFGGEVGFKIVKTASLRRLFCLNMAECPKISFKVPSYDDSTETVKDEL